MRETFVRKQDNLLNWKQKENYFSFFIQFDRNYDIKLFSQQSFPPLFSLLPLSSSFPQPQWLSLVFLVQPFEPLQPVLMPPPLVFFLLPPPRDVSLLQAVWIKLKEGLIKVKKKQKIKTKNR